MKFTKAEDIWTFWLFNGRLKETVPLQKARGSNALSNTVKEHIMPLKLERATLAQSGTYTCGANSTVIQSTQNISVSVRDVLGPELEQSYAAVQILSEKIETITCDAVYPKASYVDIFWLFNESQIQTNSKHVVNEWFRRSEGTLKRKTTSLTIYNAALNDSGQYSCVLNTSHGLRLKNFSVSVVTDPNGKFLHLLYLPSRPSEIPTFLETLDFLSLFHCNFKPISLTPDYLKQFSFRLGAR